MSDDESDLDESVYAEWLGTDGGESISSMDTSDEELTATDAGILDVAYENVPYLLRETLEPLIKCRASSFSHGGAEIQAEPPYYCYVKDLRATFGKLGFHERTYQAHRFSKVAGRLVTLATTKDKKVAALIATAAIVDERLQHEPLRARNWMRRMLDPTVSSNPERWVRRMYREGRFAAAKAFRPPGGALAKSCALNGQEDAVAMADMALSRSSRDLMEFVGLEDITDHMHRIQSWKDRLKHRRGWEEWQVRAALRNEERAFRERVLGARTYEEARFFDEEMDTLLIIMIVHRDVATQHLVAEHGYHASGGDVFDEEGVAVPLDPHRMPPAILADLMWTMVLFPRLRRRLGRAYESLRPKQERRGETSEVILRVAVAGGSLPVHRLRYRNLDAMVHESPYLEYAGDSSVRLTSEGREVDHATPGARELALILQVPLFAVKCFKMVRAWYSETEPVREADVEEYFEEHGRPRSEDPLPEEPSGEEEEVFVLEEDHEETRKRGKRRKVAAVEEPPKVDRDLLLHPRVLDKDLLRRPPVVDRDLMLHPRVLDKDLLRKPSASLSRAFAYGRM